jgi:hypothetical protein
MKTPFDWVTPNRQKPVFISLALLTALVMVCLQIIGEPLVTEAAPQGIVSFELAGSPAAARQMVASWGAAGPIYAGLSLGLDYLFMAAYAGSIGLGCVLVARRLNPSSIINLQSLGALLAWGLMAAALLDAVENFALIRLLLGAEALWPLLARWCAIPKFALVAAGLLFVLVGGFVGWIRSLPRS